MSVGEDPYAYGRPKLLMPFIAEGHHNLLIHSPLLVVRRIALATLVELLETGLEMTGEQWDPKKMT